MRGDEHGSGTPEGVRDGDVLLRDHRLELAELCGELGHSLCEQFLEAMMALPPVAWPTTLTPLIQDMAVAPGSDGKGCCRIDVDVDPKTLFLLNEFEARARHRQVQIPLADGSGCVRGEMNTLVGLGRASDPAKVSKVRISFHNVSTGDCSDDLF